ncbi:hypothetical protein HNQ80_004821 [Anaerosolibacter carboniphilus]|uniref:Uncharacterized protein n=1 Tax=Anaerosolibacter carboniphilus TaxID=1417629 RepID=A0A841KZ65_9FIRM|nr:hypothetical protein [Anaerosolibacter carboniphilus]MBB6218647.1 hypothetical protein [Anaerosolibacter carboniphilus]
MQIQINNVNPNKLYEELVELGINPILLQDDRGQGELIAQNTWITFDEDVDMDLVQQIIDDHDPTPLPPTPTEIDILGQQNVEKELQLMDIKLTNDMLGQNLVSMELRIMQLEMGGM